MPDTLRERCDRLRSLHVPGHPLVLPNSWDVTSARAVVAAGFPAVATTSASVAETLGYEDHEGAPPAEMLAVAARIASAVDVPVTVDAEAGYGMTPPELVDALLEAGAAGCNLEDTDHAAGGLADPDRHGGWLTAVREAAVEREYGLVVNARIDVFLADGGERPQIELVDEAVARARTYLAAGADCVYPILLHDADAISAFVDAVDVPVNVLATSQAPPISRLAEMNVARVSFGPLIHRRLMRELDGMLAEVARWS
jgi:2-methylisocitrate lyase-like PEP mutase family enzyme